MLKKGILTTFAVLGLLAGAAVAVYAESATVGVTAGTIGLTTNAVALPGITLNGADQTTSTTVGDNTWNGSDGRGTGGGWNVTIDATDFANGGDSINVGTGDFKLSLQNSDITVVGGSATKPTSSVTALTSIPENPAAALKILSAAATGGAGQGSYDFEPLFSLTIGAEAASVAYTSTLVVTIAAGP